ncbi:hypothetical protein IOLA_301 [uncultured bacterium]|nr:hypothetical protein IOLA_301 [uncultured bacterium]
MSGFMMIYNLKKSKEIKYPLSLSESFNKFLEIKEIVFKKPLNQNKQNIFFNNQIFKISNRGLTKFEENISICLEEINFYNDNVIDKYCLSYMLFRIYKPDIHILKILQIHNNHKEKINRNNKKNIDAIEMMIKKIQKNIHTEFYIPAISIFSDKLKISNNYTLQIFNNLEKNNYLSSMNCSKMIDQYKISKLDQYNGQLSSNMNFICQYFDIIARLLWAIDANSKVPNYDLYNAKNEIIYYFDQILKEL